MSIYREIVVAMERANGDDAVREQHRMALRSAHQRAVNEIAYTAHVVGFLLDGSLLVLGAKCAMQFVVGQRLVVADLRELEGSGSDSGGANAISVAGGTLADVRRHAQHAMLARPLTSSTETPQADISLTRRRLFLLRIVTTIGFVWVALACYQLTFCLVGSSTTHNLLGVFSPAKVNYNTHWGIGLVGEAPFESRTVHAGALLALNALGVTLEAYQAVVNIGVGLGLVDDSAERTTGNVGPSAQEHNGFQGNLVIHRLLLDQFWAVLRGVKDT